MSWNIEKPGDRINGPLTITGNTTLTGTATISGDLTVDTSTLKVDAANNRVGVGTASPSAPLDVVGNAKISGDLVVDTNTLVVDSTNNRLGIGTASPAFSLDVSGDIRSTAVVRVGTTSGDTIDIFQVAGGGYVSQPGNRFLAFGTNNVERLRIDSSGNLGLGVTPKAWSGSWRVAQIGSRMSLAVTGSDNFIGSNWYNDGSYKFIAADYATYYDQVSGKHVWGISSASGSVDGAITWGDPKMTLDASGNLGVGATPGSYRVDVKSATNSGQLRIYGADQNAITISDKAGTAAKGFLIGRSSSSDNANNFFIYDLTADQFRLEIATTGEILAGKNGSASNPVYSRGADPNTGIYFPTGNDTLALAVGGSDAIYIDAGRRVIIGGNAVPDNGLSLYVVKSGVGLGHYISATVGYIGTWTNNDFGLASNGTERLRIKSTGQLRFVPLASDPAGAEAGDVYYNSATNKLRCYNGSAWNDLF